MGEFNNRHLDLIPYSSIYDAKTILDVYTDNIYKNHRVTFIPFFYLKSLKHRKNKILSVEANINIDKYTNLIVLLLVKHVIFTNYIKGCEKQFNVIRLPNIYI